MPISDHKNFALSTLASPPSSTDGVSLTVASGHGALFPTAPFNVTVWPASVQPTSSNAEIMRVTNKASDVFTVTRAQEGTSGRTFSANDQIAATITARVLEDIESRLAGAVSITDPEYGAIGDGDVANAATNVTAIRAAIAAAAAGGKSLYIPAGTYRVNNNFTFDGDCSGMTVFGDGTASCIKLATTMDENANVECGWTFMLDGASNGALENFRLTGIRVDGNRTGIVGFDSGNTCSLIVGYQDSVFENVQVDNCTAHSALQGSGFFTYAVGIRFVDCHAYDNGYHGGATSRDTTIGDADKVTEWVNFKTHNNGTSSSSGYGLDAGRYHRNIVTNLNSYWNYEGGLKISVGTELLIVRGARLAYNLGPGFQDTDTVGTAKLDLDGIVTHNNGSVGFRLVSGSDIRIGSINSYDNYCHTGASRSGNSYTGGSLATSDIQIGTSTGFIKYFTADVLRTKGSTCAGVHLDGNILGYTIGKVIAEESETYGFGDFIQQAYTAWADATAYVVGDIRSYSSVNYYCTAAHTSVLADNRPGTGSSWQTKWQVLTTDGVVQSGLFIANNNAGTAAAGAAAAFQCGRNGGIKALGLIFRDNQATITQHTAMYFLDGADAYVDGCHFGSGIASSGDGIYTANAPTRVRFGDSNSGNLVFRARGAASEAGGAGTVTVTYPTAISSFGGSVFFSMVYPTSADASEANYISAVSRTALTLTCPGTFGGGAGTVTFRYDVQLEIQR